MSIENVRDALEGILESWAVTNSVPVAWENQTINPALDEPYVMSFLMPVETVEVGRALDDSQDFNGIYQVSVYTEKGKGTATSKAIVGSLLTEFSRGVTVTIGAQIIRVEMSYASPALDFDAWYTVPVTIRYRSITK